MLDGLKKIIKKLPVNFTKNQVYDAQTRKIFEQVLKSDSVYVDVGAHLGEVLDIAIECAPEARHFGFEAIPQMAEALKKKYSKHHIYHLALSDHEGTTQFHHVKTNPAYSGIRKREYKRVEDIEIISIPVNTMDAVLGSDQRVDLIKIDVEGAELQVLKGASETIRRERPVIVFEHGLGASDYYQSGPDELWTLLCQELGMKIGLMKNYLADDESGLDREAFRKQYEEQLNYYFVAY